MKIEKVNDYQIRCTLTKEDLDGRALKISELAYGSPKARELFRDMMQQAAFEFGFESDDLPLMIEAIPLNSECLVLVVTKVEDPEELDTRFARFSPAVNEAAADQDHNNASDSGFPNLTSEIQEIKDLYEKLHGISEKFAASANASAKEKDATAASKTSSSASAQPVTRRSFLFDSMNTLMSLSRILGKELICSNDLFKDPKTGNYLLVVSSENLSAESYGKICNTLSEYGTATKEKGTAYMTEHLELLIEGSAIQTLAGI